MTFRRALKDVEKTLSELERAFRIRNRQAALGPLVGASDLRTTPVHRWYFYKEGFSPKLPALMHREFGAGKTNRVVDPFGGVGTTALAIASATNSEAVSIEYSPFADWVGKTKWHSARLSPENLSAHLNRLVAAPLVQEVQTPSLSSFSNPAIFKPSVLRALLSARQAIDTDASLTDAERSFFRLGLAAVIEDSSGAMKDGRALRVRGQRKRRPSGLIPPASHPVGVSGRLRAQWTAMVDDLRTVQQGEDPKGAATFLRGDARTLSGIDAADRHLTLEDESAGLFVYSPPYLNFIDYSEVYKLELWLLGFVSSRAGFRILREGTLRSHPSIKFPVRVETAGDGSSHRAVKTAASFLEAHAPRASTGTTVRDYFADMRDVLLRQWDVLEPGGCFALVVANSTFSGAAKDEEWHLHIPTDAVLGSMAKEIGYSDVTIWKARELRPRNFRDGVARESVLTGRKASGNH